MKGTILVTDNIHLTFFKMLEGSDLEIDYRPEITQDELLQIVQDYEGIVINSKTTVDRAMLEKGGKLRFVARMGSGMEIVDTACAQEKNIACISVPEGNRDAVAELAVGLLLCLLRHIHTANAEVKNGQWLREANRGLELGGRTIGIIGFGNTGSGFAQRLSGFNVKVLAYDKYKNGFSGAHVHESSMDEIFEQADVFSIHLPLTSETKYLVDHDFLKKFKKPVFLLNTARGKNIKTTDLLLAMREGKVMGAALDVLENEKPDALNEEEKIWFDELVRSKRILLTPHIAGLTRESKEKIATMLATKIKELKW